MKSRTRKRMFLLGGWLILAAFVVGMVWGTVVFVNAFVQVIIKGQ